MRRIILTLLALSTPVSVQAASYSFTWQGANGYHVEGAFSISDDLVKEEHITHTDVPCFRIHGFLNDELIGAWRLGNLTDETSWRFNFRPNTLQIPMGGRRSDRSDSQEWNMNGRGNDCGEGGFGFNSGSAAQDVCLDNRLIRPSQIHPDRLLFAKRNDDLQFKSRDCEIQLLS